MDAETPHADPGDRFDAHDIEALADGELSPDRVALTLKAIRADPSLEQRLATQLGLRQAVARSMTAPDAPEPLRERIANLIQEHGDEPVMRTPAAPAVVGRLDGSGSRAASGGPTAWLRWSPAAAAAILAILAWVGFTQDVRPPMTGGVAPVVSREHLDVFAWRHVTCASEPAQLQATPTLPNQIEQAARGVSAFLDAPVPGDLNLDLTPAGYVFVGAGACRVPGGKAAHLLYHADPATGLHDAMSLWITTRGELPADLARRVADNGMHVIGEVGSRQAHPMVVWTVGDVVFFLMGENPARVRRAAEMVRLSDPTTASPV